MLINGTTSVQGVYKNYKAKPKQNPYTSKQNADVQEISQTGKDFSLAMEKLKNVDATRSGKVENIKNQVSNGTYVVDSTKIARAMLLGEVNY